MSDPVYVVHHTSHGEEGEIYGVFTTEEKAKKYSAFLTKEGYYGVRISRQLLDVESAIKA